MSEHLPPDPSSLPDFLGLDPPPDTAIPARRHRARWLGPLVLLLLVFLLGAGLYLIGWRTGDRVAQVANTAPAIVRMPVLPREPSRPVEEQTRQDFDLPASPETTDSVASAADAPVETQVLDQPAVRVAEPAAEQPRTVAPAVRPETATVAPQGAFSVQVGAYLYPESLRGAQAALTALHLPYHVLQKQTEVRMYRVRAARLPTGQGAAALQRLQGAFPQAFVVTERGRDLVCLGLVVTRTAAAALAARYTGESAAEIDTVVQLQTLQVLRTGAFATRSEAQATADRLVRKGFRPLVVRQDGKG